MNPWLILFMLSTQPVYADIFVKSNQEQTDTYQVNDEQNFYYRHQMYYNPPASADSKPYELSRANISLGCNRYNVHESLKNFITREEFNGFELEELMQRLSSSRLMVWQYSSPALADLYKHLDTTGQLRLGLRYHQCENLEQSIMDPLIKLRKQSIMDCIKRKGGLGQSGDIDLALKSCFDHASDGEGVSLPFESLEDPGNGNSYIRNTIDLTAKVLDRVNQSGIDIEVIKDILPHVLVSSDAVSIRGATISSRGLMNRYRKEYLQHFNEMIQSYEQGQEISAEELSLLSVVGAPMTEGQIRNIALLDESAAVIVKNQLASELGYLKTIDHFSLAAELLQRVMDHPAIQAGYKELLKSSVAFVVQETIGLKEEKQRLADYFNAMSKLLNHADQERIKIMSIIHQRLNTQQEKGLLKLNQ